MVTLGLLGIYLFTFGLGIFYYRTFFQDIFIYRGDWALMLSAIVVFIVPLLAFMFEQKNRYHGFWAKIMRIIGSIAMLYTGFWACPHMYIFPFLLPPIGVGILVPFGKKGKCIVALSAFVVLFLFGRV